MNTKIEPLVRRLTDPVFRGLERLTDSLAPHVEEVDGVTKRRYSMPDDMAKENISVEYRNGTLFINAYHEEKGEHTFASRKVSFREMIGDVDVESMTSTFENDVLTVEYTSPVKDTSVTIDVS